MPLFLAKFLAPLAPYLAAALIIMAGTAYVIHLRHALDDTAFANAALVQTNQTNLAAIAAYQAQSVKYNAALDTLGAQTLAQNHAVDTVYQQIDAEPSSADAPVAPVLHQALADIAKLQAGAK